MTMGIGGFPKEAPVPLTGIFATGVLDNPFYCGKIVYFRRTNRGRAEKDQREEITVRGKQEAIIPEEMWERVQTKRKQGAVRYEKDEPERISMLSRPGEMPCVRGRAGSEKKQNHQPEQRRALQADPLLRLPVLPGNPRDGDAVSIIPIIRRSWMAP